MAATPADGIDIDVDCTKKRRVLSCGHPGHETNMPTGVKALMLKCARQALLQNGGGVGRIAFDEDEACTRHPPGDLREDDIVLRQKLINRLQAAV